MNVCFGIREQLFIITRRRGRRRRIKFLLHSEMQGKLYFLNFRKARDLNKNLQAPLLIRGLVYKKLLLTVSFWY